MHNLSEVKGQFFNKMWRHFAAKWKEWQKETFRDGAGNDQEAQRRRKAATKTIKRMYTVSDQVSYDIAHALQPARLLL